MPIYMCRYELGAALPFHPEQMGPLSFLTTQKWLQQVSSRSCLSEASIPPTHSVNKNITGMVLPLAASCLVEEAKAYPVLSIQHPTSWLI